MKKKIVNVFISAAVITTMTFFATACSSKTNVQAIEADPVESATQQEPTVPAESTIVGIQESITADVQEPTASDVQESTVAETEEPNIAAEGTMTLEEWTKSDECAQFSEMMNEGLDGMTISFEVDGDMISLIFTMTEAIDVTEDADEAMSAYFTSNSAIFEAIRNQLIDETGNENTVLKIVYRNADDSEIFGMEF